MRAYRNAARTVASLPQSVADRVAEAAELSSLPGIGKDLAAKITEIVNTGHGLQNGQRNGVKMAISTDAHSVNHLACMRFGIDQARHGWLEADEVLNTRSWEALQKLLKRP